METLVLKVDAANPDPGAIRQAAEVIRAGGLVGFPTETVYGLGANALDAAAVARIFEAKGRPATNPLIVHVADASEVRTVATNWPETAAKLAERFWPDPVRLAETLQNEESVEKLEQELLRPRPLTLVVSKSDRVPDIVTAGGPTVAVRCPDHPVARALIRAAGVPIAAPSANRSTELSPTRAEHVLKGLNGRIDLLLDGGACWGGIESTVVDVTGEIPRVLRPGLVTVPMLEEVCGRVDVGASSASVSRSPGQMAKHYSPRTPVVLCDAAEAHRRAWEDTYKYRRVGLMLTHGQAATVPRHHSRVGFPPAPFCRPMSDEPEGYAAELYAVLHEMDVFGLDAVYIALPPDAPEWTAVRDRLTRAAASGETHLDDK